LGRIEKLIEIKASPEKVWEMLALDRHAEWDSEMEKSLESLEYTSEVHSPEDKYRVGTVAHMNMKGMGMGELDFEITESLENEKMTFDVRKSGNNKTSGSVTFLLEPTEVGTKFTSVYGYELPGGVFGKFLDRLFASRMEGKHVEKCLERLKSILEKQL